MEDGDHIEYLESKFGKSPGSDVKCLLLEWFLVESTKEWPAIIILY
jgi:hypothetical protein